MDINELVDNYIILKFLMRDIDSPEMEEELLKLKRVFFKANYPDEQFLFRVKHYLKANR